MSASGSSRGSSSTPCTPSRWPAADSYELDPERSEPIGDGRADRTRTNHENPLSHEFVGPAVSPLAAGLRPYEEGKIV